MLKPDAGADPAVRHDWSAAEIRALHDLPLPELIWRAQSVHRAHHATDAVQLCTLLSIKTGGCSEDCAYCPQSAHYKTGVPAQELLGVKEVLSAAGRAREAGATRFCMGAAWRDAEGGEPFERVLAMVRGVRALGLEACATLGMLDREQAGRLADAGLTAYNHNLDSSRAFYGSIIGTRSYEDRLRTLEHVRAAGITVCCGGILGMGESVDDRCELLATLARLDPHPESVPINALVAVPGTPLEGRPTLDPIEHVRAIACARIAMPRSFVRLSAGRESMNREAQLLCLLAGANSIFYGERLLTQANPGEDQDRALLEAAGMRGLAPEEGRP